MRIHGRREKLTHWLGFRVGKGRFRLYLRWWTVYFNWHGLPDEVPVTPQLLAEMSWKWMLVWRPLPQFIEVQLGDWWYHCFKY